MVSGNIIAPPHQEITEIVPSHVALRAQIQVGKCSLFSIRNAKAPVDASRIGELRSIRMLAATTRINRFVVRIIGRACCLSQVLARTDAGVNETAITQLPPRVKVKSPPLALRIRGVWTTAVRSFTPV